MDDGAFMAEALALAETAAALGEVPVGAVLVVDGQVVARGHNERESAADPTAHAEVLALRRGAAALHRWRIGGTLYVTLEPCAMCAGALVLARVDRLVYAAPDPKAGAVRSLFRLADDPRLNHRLIIEEGLERERASEILKSFFRARRARNSDGE